MSSATSRAESGNIVYGNADSSGTSSTLIIAVVVVIVAIIGFFALKQK